MPKVILEMGYKSYVLEADKALAIMELLEGAERFMQKYHTGSNHTYHVYEEDFDMSLKYLSPVRYNLAKLAGKPEEK